MMVFDDDSFYSEATEFGIGFGEKCGPMTLMIGFCSIACDRGTPPPDNDRVSIIDTLFVA